jgi:DNA-binding MarR family transcriptional regulator
VSAATKALSAGGVELLTMLDAYTGGEGTVAPGVLAERLGWSLDLVRVRTATLVARGLVERVTGAGGRRPTYRLTPSGRRRAAHEIAKAARAAAADGVEARLEF